MLAKSKLDAYQLGHQAKVNSISKENLFDECDVERYDADTYRQKYGDRWKKFASSVRDVVQADGTIIREYVIEDPTLLDQLSEDDEKAFKIEKGDMLSNKMAQKSMINFPNEFKPNVNNKRNNFEKSYNHQKFNLSSSSSSSSGPTTSNSSGTSLTNSKNINLFQPILSANNNAKQQQNFGTKTLNKYDDNSSKSVSSRSNVDDLDKEVENIHEQGKQLKNIEYNQLELPKTVIEYEVLDEHGNQIMINGAEELKKLAACVNEIKQSDGSVVKEYILNDPKVIEQIRNQMKTKSQSNADVDRFSPLPSLSSTLTSSNPFLNQVKQQIQKFQQIPPPPPPPMVHRTTNIFEFRTKRGKVLQLSLSSENASDSDCEELRNFLKKNESECQKLIDQNQKNYAFQPKNTNMYKSGSLDNILDPKPVNNIKTPQAQKTNLPVYLNYLNQTKSISNMNKLENKSNLSETNSKSQDNLSDKKFLINQTYTKSTIPNYMYPIISDAKKIPINNNTKSKLNKSLDNLDAKEKTVTPEMTEQLLLKLLLHQLSLQKEEKYKKRYEEEDDGTSLSNDTFSSSSCNSKPKIGGILVNRNACPQSTTSANISSGSAIASSSNGSSANLNLNKNKKLLFQKSMSNFNYCLNEKNESDMDDFENLIKKKNMNQFNAAKNKLKQNYF